MWAVTYFFFFFQAEDGIRDIGVTGVQTCALPIWVLDDEGADHTLLHALYLLGRCIPTYDDYIAGLASLAHGFGCAEHPWLVGGEDGVEVGVGGEDVLGDPEGDVVVALARLLGDELELGVILKALLEPLFSLLVGDGALLEGYEGDLPATLTELVRDQAGHLPCGGHVVRGEDGDVVRLGLRARVDVDHGHVLLLGRLGHLVEYLGVGRGVDEAVYALLDKVLQQVHLAVEIGRAHV